MVSDRGGYSAASPREYKWRAPGVKNPSKNVARRVRDICFAAERCLRSRPVRANQANPPYSYSHLSFFLFCCFFFLASTNPERIEEVVHRRREISQLYLIEKLFSLQRAHAHTHTHTRGRSEERAARRENTTRAKIVKRKRTRGSGD